MAHLLSRGGSALIVFVILTASAFADDVALTPILAKGQVTVPESSEPQGIGILGGVAQVFSSITASVGLPLVNPPELRTANTNVANFVPDVKVAPATPGQQTSSDYFIETPASIACIYGLVPREPGCNPNVVKALPDGGGKVIVIVDAFDAPNIKSDLVAFSTRFGLSPADFDVIYAANTRPERDEGWEEEISLDVEWAHAMAPGAKIRLVEAKSAELDDLLAAVDVANGIVTQFGGGQISMSWDSSEYTGESDENSAHFSTPGAIYLAASGDNPGVWHPAVLSHVIGVGGTTTVRDSNGQFLGELPWSEAGAGLSALEPKPAYQSAIAQVVGYRGVVDIAAVADPRVGGVWVFDSGNSNFSSNDGWLSVGGTSVATPIVAGIINRSRRGITTTTDELTLLYSELGSPAFNHIGNGTCGVRGVYSTTNPGWTFCTGLGSPAGDSGM